MAPAITLLINPDSDIDDKLVEGNIAETLFKHADCFADGDTKSKLLLKQKYGGCNGRFFHNLKSNPLHVNTDRWVMIPCEDILTNKDTFDSFYQNKASLPRFVITFDHDYEPEWLSIGLWVNAIFNGVTPSVYETNYMKIMKYNVLETHVPDDGDKNITSIEMASDEQQSYSYRTLVDNDRDLIYVEVLKPFTDRPYTVIIRAYSKRGILPFFTSLYVCSSWGVCNSDHVFLTRLWDYLDMSTNHGDFDLPNRLKKDIEACYPGKGRVPDSEPEVYRLTIEQVREQLNKKRKL